jgi:hypothetical protein
VAADGSGGSSNTGAGGSGISSAGEPSSTSGTSGTNTGGTNGTAGTSNANGGTPSDDGGSSNSSDAGTGSGGDAAGAGGGSGDPVECNGAHPQVSGQNRFCLADACYCNAPFDTCFPEETAQTCCENTPRCGNEPGDRGVSCTGQHPIIEPVRTCTSGNCFCSDGDAGNWDVCLPEDVAAFCCPPGVSLTCIN